MSDMSPTPIHRAIVIVSNDCDDAATLADIKSSYPGTRQLDILIYPPKTGTAASMKHFHDALKSLMQMRDDDGSYPQLHVDNSLRALKSYLRGNRWIYIGFNAPALA